MKHRFILLFLFLNLAQLGAQTTSDYALVEQTVRYYLDGGTNRDFATLKKAFHADAVMQSVGEDGRNTVNALEFFERVMKPGDPVDRVTRVAHLDVAGNAATARLEIDYPTFTFVDFVTLLKENGEWKIVSKVFYRRPTETK